MICATLARQDEVDRLWPELSPDIVKCIEKTPTFFTAGDLWAMCRSGEGFLIVVHEGATVIGGAVWRFEGQSLVCLMLTGTHADEWIGAMYDRAAIVARGGGAKQLMASGRIGLFRKLRKNLPMVKMIRCTVAVEV